MSCEGKILTENTNAASIHLHVGVETFKFPFYYTDGILLFIGTIENSHKNSTHTASDPATSLDTQSISNKTHPYRDLALWLVLSWGTWGGLSLLRHKKYYL